MPLKYEYLWKENEKVAYFIKFIIGYSYVLDFLVSYDLTECLRLMLEKCKQGAIEYELFF